ncbi:uncharacterized protein LTR77_007810 [Saxophila tyrrhenica]|uniref:Uncharacterized protein n=1 Tax=Saxophila tyrrhenica TaxID=1690608 RepID=A0AAV9P601_9PEZI|nr:hypothetical protein LTR77_007810 [Saxophila tyrrhenica]
MPLHHRPEMFDIRSAYKQPATSERRYPSDSDSDRSYKSNSDRSYQTQPTSCSSNSTRQSHHVRCHTHEGRSRDGPPRYFDDRQVFESPPASPSNSVETYASTVDGDLDQPEREDIPDFDVPDYTRQPTKSSAIAATPSEFSDLFPSGRQLHIRHDDSTIDGNMNLRVDADVFDDRKRYDMTLFHLRLHDLKHREFSLRRYCRDSGREVCHSVQKSQTAAQEKRPAIQRSLSNALQSMRPKSERRSSAVPTLASLKRNDSGYASITSDDLNDFDRQMTSSHGTKEDEFVPSKSIKLEFSNYAQVDVKRIGAKGNKRYEFQYWGVSYAWRRVVTWDGDRREAAFYLMRAGSDRPCAHITPDRLDRTKAQEERNSGGWIPRCTMAITDKAIIRSGKDVADTVVATGLIALVDDTIRNHFHSETAKQLLIPVPKFGVEYVGPKRLINEMFGRRDTFSGQASRPSSSGGPPSAAGALVIFGGPQTAAA